jgi:hypothetical protein
MLELQRVFSACPTSALQAAYVLVEALAFPAKNP